jgi:hypothetical protein
MATFEAQVEGLTSLAIDGSSAPTQTELTQFLTDGAKEIINILPPNLLDWCASQQTFTSVMPGSEGETMNTGKILRDFDSVCRRIRADEKGYATDPDEMIYASVTDPVFYTENNKLNALPESGSCKYDEVQYPSVAYGDSAIAVFPDEAEYLVTLYGAVKSLQNVLGDKSSNSDITTALTAINAEIDECLSIADNVHTEIALINTQTDSAVAEIVLANVEVDKMATEVGLDNAELDKATAELTEAAALVDSNIDTAVAAITTALGRVNTAVALGNTEFDLVNPEVDLANAQVDAEDIELANGYIATAQGYANAGAKYISEAQASLSEAQGYASEVSARTGHVSAQVGVAQAYIASGAGYSRVADGYSKVANGYLGNAKDYLQAAQGFASVSKGYIDEIQSKIGIAQAYSNEVQSRLQVDTAHYGWYEKQQVKLQADYEGGIQKLLGGYKD